MSLKGLGVTPVLSLRERMVVQALAAVGLSTAPVEHRARTRTDAAGASFADPRPESAYLDLVAPLLPHDAYREAHAEPARLARVNGCALVIRGLLLRLGFRIPLGPVTEWGTARETVLGAFVEAGALRRPGSSGWPPDARVAKPGDVIDLDSRPAVGNSIRAHLAILLSVEHLRAGAVAIRTVDGGQREPDSLGSQCVRSKRVVFERAGVGDWRSSQGKLAQVGDLEGLARHQGVPL